MMVFYIVANALGCGGYHQALLGYPYGTGQVQCHTSHTVRFTPSKCGFVQFSFCCRQPFHPSPDKTLGWTLFQHRCSRGNIDLVSGVCSDSPTRLALVPSIPTVLGVDWAMWPKPGNQAANAVCMGPPSSGGYVFHHL